MTEVGAHVRLDPAAKIRVERLPRPGTVDDRRDGRRDVGVRGPARRGAGPRDRAGRGDRRGPERDGLTPRRDPRGDGVRLPLAGIARPAQPPLGLHGMAPPAGDPVRARAALGGRGDGGRAALGGRGGGGRAALGGRGDGGPRPLRDVASPPVPAARQSAVVRGAATGSVAMSCVPRAPAAGSGSRAGRRGRSAAASRARSARGLGSAARALTAA